MGMFIILILVIIPQQVCISNNSFVHFKYVQLLFVDYSSIELETKRNECILNKRNNKNNKVSKLQKPQTLFLIAAVTTYYKFTGLKQHTFIILQFWRSAVQKSRCQRGEFFLELQGKLCFLAFSSFQEPPAFLSWCSFPPFSKPASNLFLSDLCFHRYTSSDSHSLSSLL